MSRFMSGVKSEFMSRMAMAVLVSATLAQTAFAQVPPL